MFSFGSAASQSDVNEHVFETIRVSRADRSNSPAPKADLDATFCVSSCPVLPRFWVPPLLLQKIFYRFVSHGISGTHAVFHGQFPNDYQVDKNKCNDSFNVDDFKYHNNHPKDDGVGSNCNRYLIFAIGNMSSGGQKNDDKFYGQSSE